MKSKPYRYGLITVLSIASNPSAGVQVTDVEITDLILSILDSPYANLLTRQFVFASITKISSRPTTSNNQQERIAAVLAGYTTNLELELQQRAVEFACLFSLGELRVGVLERMPPPELKATVTGIGTCSPDMPYFDR
jgi:AP-1 complex subunit gamma-1